MATTVGIDSGDIRDLMIESAERRLGLVNRVDLRRVRRAAGLSTRGSTAGFRMCRLRAAAFGDRRDGLSPHPHATLGSPTTPAATAIVPSARARRRKTGLPACRRD